MSTETNIKRECDRLLKYGLNPLDSCFVEMLKTPNLLPGVSEKIKDMQDILLRLYLERLEVDPLNRKVVCNFCLCAPMANRIFPKDLEYIKDKILEGYVRFETYCPVCERMREVSVLPTKTKVKP